MCLVKPEIKIIVGLLLAAQCQYVGADPIQHCEESLIPIERVAPAYPTSPIRRSESNFVVLEFVVDETGIPSGIKVVESSDRLFERSAMLAISDWRYPKRPSRCLHRIKLTYEIEE